MPFIYRPIIAIFIFYSYWIPQIKWNIVSGTRRTFHVAYCIGTTASRLFIPLYLLGCPSNFFSVLLPGVIPFSPATCLTLVIWSVIQMTVLLLQVRSKLQIVHPRKYPEVIFHQFCCNYFHLSRTPFIYPVHLSSIPYTYRLFCTVRNFIYPVHLSAVLVCSNFIYPVHLSAVIYCRTYWAQGFVFQHPCFHELMTTTDRFPLMCYVAPTVRLSQGTRMQDPPRQEMWKMEG